MCPFQIQPFLVFLGFINRYSKENFKYEGGEISHPVKAEFRSMKFSERLKGAEL
jgi:hypothetical protein